MNRLLNMRAMDLQYPSLRPRWKSPDGITIYVDLQIPNAHETERDSRKRYTEAIEEFIRLPSRSGGITSAQRIENLKKKKKKRKGFKHEAFQ